MRMQENDAGEIEVNELNPVLIEQLLEVWDKSVRETHLFLPDSEIKSISKYIPQVLNSIAHLIVAVNDENKPVAFMGIEEIPYISVLDRQIRLLHSSGAQIAAGR